MLESTCDRCAYREPHKTGNVHDLTDQERTLAVHFLREIYAAEGDERRSSYPPEDPATMLAHDPHYLLCSNAIHTARRLLLAFPDLSTRPGQQATP